jgi:O-antigen ligase
MKKQEKHAPSGAFWVLLLVLMLIQFTGAWAYPPASEFGAELRTERTLGVPFQYSLWLLILLAMAWHVNKAGFAPLFRVLRLFVPFWAIGLLAAVFGFDPISSTRSVVLWSLMAIGAALITIELPAERVVRVVNLTTIALMLASALLALALPTYGTHLSGSVHAWRGVFVGKNMLGWIAALLVVANVVMVNQQNWRLAGGAALLAFICLVGSDSKGALMAALITLGYLFMLTRLRRRLTPGFAVGVLVFLLLLTAVMIFLVAPFLLEALGRDATLTGRTDVWSTYLAAIVKTPWLGEGPGAYTTLSPLTAPLAQRLAYLGAILTPHNIYLGVIGDTGLFGLIIFLCTLIYLATILPLRLRGQGTLMCAVVGFLILAHGMVETHEILIPGPGWFLLMLAYGLVLKHAVAAPTRRAQRPARQPLRDKLAPS